jgi:peptide/nickel transport system ATP-binding protein
MTSLNPVMRIGRQINETFEAHGALDGAARAVRVQELLIEVGLPDPTHIARAYPHELSGGQRQRVMIAMALALEPKLLIADEPTTALDVTTQAQILKLIDRLRRTHGTAVMFITHDFGVVADSLKGQVSWVSPIARALLKSRVGDVVKLQTPKGVQEIEVMQVRYPAPGQV